MSNKFDIFISYRREGGYDTAKHLNDLLVRDGYRVSFDIDTLRSGDFDTQLYARIDQCKDFILIVDPHAFDRTLDPKTNPQEDWLRCELAYALQKKKNIIPVFLAGANGFPKGLPADVIGVTKKNGPEYNRYHFNAFYADLKKRFLKSRTLKPYLIGLGVCVIVACIVGMAIMIENYRHSERQEEQIDTVAQDPVLPYPEVEITIPWSEAKSIAKDVMMRNPIMAVGYKDGREKIVALFNTNVDEGDYTPQIDEEPRLQLVVLLKEAGVWSKEYDKDIDMQKFEDLGAYIFDFNDTCFILHTEDQYYLYFHCEFGPGGNSSAETWYDYVALNIADGSYTHVSYFVDPRTYSSNGELHKEESYPKGIEDYLLGKLEADNQATKIGTSHQMEEEDMFKDWFVDNPQCYNRPDELDYNQRHFLTVKMYDNRPDQQDYQESRDMYTMTNVGHYTIYNRWRGNVYGYDKKKKKYFPIWGERTKFCNKVVEVLGDNEIRMIYDDFGDIGDTVDAVVYNLEFFSYHYEQYYIDHEL